MFTVINKIKYESFRILDIISDQPASKVKLTSRFVGSQMSQFLRLVTQIIGNERKRVTNRSANDGMLYCGRASAEYFGAADCAQFSTYYIITILMTRAARGITSMIQKRLDKLGNI